jgi:hypothetical protein
MLYQLELLTQALGPFTCRHLDLALLVERVGPAGGTKFLALKLLCRKALISACAIVLVLTSLASQDDLISHRRLLV